LWLLKLLYRECALVTSGSNWKYDASGVELRPDFINPVFDDASWSTGAAPLGFRGCEFDFNHSF
jgi:hypothetical protein